MRIVVRGRPAGSPYRLWNLDEKRLVQEGTCGGEAEWNLGETPHDFALLVLGPTSGRIAAVE